ncbi:hypothetical protein BW721_08420 [Jeotgalibaca sp. PTS2502]|uniref:YeiH family protein n=1 Tax=Jeotgalibaca sp. PTS2502 TaxID=1903686 RepID=UPI000973596D|nr:putative sulfate exporter family transporter [Jeotgalibaca sp. PTS2502]APZ49679.1 hypothetical protein BW721_08420 [Jeotgalibaca sp. PTS2502]
MFITILPGLLISLFISLLSQFLTNFLPQLSAALIAIALGMLFGNTLFIHPRLNPGTQFAEKRLLEVAIVLNGLTLDFQMMREIGLVGLVFVFIQLLTTILIAIVLGKLFKFSKVFSLLMAAGNAVCGTAAIGTVSPILDAESKDKGMAITTVNVVGTVMMMGLPLVALFLYNHELLPTSALIGGVIQSVGQVVASAKLVNDDVVNLATVFKLIRVLMIAVVGISFSRLNLTEGESFFKNKQEESTSVSINIPWFIIGFLILFIVRSLTILPQTALSFTKTASSQFEIIALAAIGMRINMRDILKEGPKVMAYGFSIGLLQALVAIILISIFY